VRKLTLDQAAKELGIKRSSVYKRTQRHTLPYTIGPDGRMYVYLDDEKAADRATDEDAAARTWSRPGRTQSRLWSWAGFGSKTVWDWLQLLSMLTIPVIIAASGFWLTAQQAQQAARQQAIEDQSAQQAREIEEQRAEPTPTTEEPKPIKSTTCVLREANVSEPKLSTAESSELRVTLSVPSNAQECHDTVTIDAPTFGLGKEATQSVSVVRPQESYAARWLLDPEKPGRWSIAVETKQDRVVIPVLITTSLGFPAQWVDGATLFFSLASLVFGFIGIVSSRQMKRTLQ
jgi:hypothetical protein